MPAFRNGYLLPCLVATLGGLLFGFDHIVIGGAKPFYEPYLGLTGAENAWASGFAMAAEIFGCILGAVGFMWLPDRVGRKPSLTLSAVFFAVGAIWVSASTSFWSFVAARMFEGAGIGIATNASPVYIAEMSPADRRGRMVALNQLAIVTGIIMAQVSNWAIYKLVPDVTVNWRVMFGMGIIPAVAFFILTWFIPESPGWLAQKGRERAESVVRSGRWRGTLGVIALGVFLAAFQQWCGITVVFTYAEEVFAAAGFDVSGVMFNQMITGSVNFTFTIVALLLVDRVGRRPLMLWGSGGLALVFSAIGLGYFLGLKGIVMVVLVMSAIACFAVTLGPVVWVLLSELFPVRVRGTAMSIAVAALWSSCYGLVLTFPPINVACGAAGTFWLYGAICTVGFAVCAKCLKETNGTELQ